MLFAQFSLFHRTSVFCIGTEDTAFALFGPQNCVAMHTLVKVLTDIFRHFDFLGSAADRTS